MKSFEKLRAVEPAGEICATEVAPGGLHHEARLRGLRGVPLVRGGGWPAQLADAISIAPNILPLDKLLKHLKIFA